MANVFDKLVGTEHIVCESSLLHATYGGAKIRDLIMDKDRDNGTVVGRSAVTTSYKDVQAFTAKDAAAGEPVFLLLTSPMGYNTARKAYTDEKYFYNAKDEIARAYQLEAEDIFTVSEMAITPSASTGPVVGHYVKFDNATMKFIESTSAPASGICIAQIIEEVSYFAAGTVSKRYRLLVVHPSK